MVIGVLASMAEFERELVKERTALKRAMSRANGTRFGRAKKVGNPGHIATARWMKDDGHTTRAIAKYLGVSRAGSVSVLGRRSCVAPGGGNRLAAYPWQGHRQSKR